MKTFKKIAGLAGLLLIAVLSVVLIRTLAFSSKQIHVPSVAPVKIDENSAIEHLSQGIQIQTVTHDDPSQNDYNNLTLLRDYIDAQYPLIHQDLKRTIINNYSLLYEWDGTNPGEKPIILLAHMDVVPANPSEWKHDPFSGQLIDGVIWGRGAIDDKGSLFSILESVEHLLESGYTPKRTVYLAFGHDEEAGTTGGMTGARKIAEHLQSEGVHPELVMDEGLTILDERLSAVKGQKFALVGIAEKGWVTLKITATGQSGHSSMPGKDTTIGLLAKAVGDLDKNKMPSSLNGVLGLSLDYFGPEMPFFQKAVFANRWLFGNLIMSELQKSNGSAAMLHTTVAPTIIQGGTKEQTLPTSAFVIVNFRIIPGETAQDVLNRVKGTFTDPRIKVEQFGTVIHEPAPISRIDGEGFRIITKTVREVFPDVMVAPGLVTGRTDSVYYVGIADNVFRFAPYVYGPDELPQVHGLDERISTASYLDMIQFYIRFIQNSSGS